MIDNKLPSSHWLLSHTDGIASAWQDLLLLAARVLLGWIFISSGWEKLNDIPGFIKADLASHGVPIPELVGYVAAPAEFFGGIMILLGLATRYASLLMILFVIGATAVSHRYWEYTGQLLRAQQTQFLKNVAIVGGFVLLFASAGGRWSIDCLLARIAQRAESVR